MPGRWGLAPLVVLVLAGCAAESTGRPVAGPTSPLPASSTATGAASAPSAEGVSPADVVDDPAARLVDVVVSQDDPRVRAASWRTCDRPDCSSSRVALVVTTEGSGPPVLADRTWRTGPVVSVDGDGNAVVASWEQRFALALVRPDGTTGDVRRTRATAPVAPGEIVGGVEHGRRGAEFWATDPASAVAHPVPVPPQTQQLARLATGQLRAITRRGTYAWSDDGGATWTESVGASDALLQSFVTSTPDLHVLVGGGDGATLFPFGEIRWIHDEDGWSVTTVPDGPRAYVGATAVLPDGRFLADVEAWSDTRRAARGVRGTPPGLHVSDGSDWTSYSRLGLGQPFTQPRLNVPDVRHVAVAGTRTTLGAIGPDGRSWWVSTDLGATWTEQRVR